VLSALVGVVPFFYQYEGMVQDVCDSTVLAFFVMLAHGEDIMLYTSLFFCLLTIMHAKNREVKRVYYAVRTCTAMIDLKVATEYVLSIAVRAACQYAHEDHQRSHVLDCVRINGQRLEDGPGSFVKLEVYHFLATLSQRGDCADLDEVDDMLREAPLWAEGGGNADLHGLYTANGDNQDGKPIWVAANGARLEWWSNSSKGAAWWWRGSDGMPYVCGVHSTARTPPSTGWEDYQDNLQSPAPELPPVCEERLRGWVTKAYWHGFDNHPKDRLQSFYAMLQYVCMDLIAAVEPLMFIINIFTVSMLCLSIVVVYNVARGNGLNLEIERSLFYLSGFGMLIMSFFVARSMFLGALINLELNKHAPRLRTTAPALFSQMSFVDPESELREDNEVGAHLATSICESIERCDIRFKWVGMKLNFGGAIAGVFALFVPFLHQFGVWAYEMLLQVICGGTLVQIPREWCAANSTSNVTLVFA